MKLALILSYNRQLWRRQIRRAFALNAGGRVTSVKSGETEVVCNITLRRRGGRMYHYTQETQNDGECSHYIKHRARPGKIDFLPLNQELVKKLPPRYKGRVIPPPPPKMSFSSK